MKNYLSRILLIGILWVLNPSLSTAGLLDDLSCELTSLLGSNCAEIAKMNETIAKINAFQDEQQGQWIKGAMTATQMVRSVVDFHRGLMPINSYDKELYAYNLQVAQVCDANKISKEQGLYLMTKKENELNERIQARMPPPNRSLTCTSRSYGGTTTTSCY